MTMLLSIPEAAVELRIGISLMKEIIASGQVASLKIGRRHMVPRTALEAFVQRLTNDAAAQSDE